MRVEIPAHVRAFLQKLQQERENKGLSKKELQKLKRIAEAHRGTRRNNHGLRERSRTAYAEQV